MTRAFAAERILVIQRMTAEACGVSFESMASPDRRRKMAYARHLAMWLCRDLLGAPYTAIGKAFGGRDHSTVIKGIYNSQRLYDDVPFYTRTRDSLVQSLKEPACQ